MTRIVLIGGAAVVAFDAAASLLLQRLGGSLVWMFAGEVLMYFVVGVVAGRRGGLGAGTRAGAAVGAIDSTAGWAITWAIGTGRVSRLAPASVTIIILTMITTGVVMGGAGALCARLWSRPSRVAADHVSDRSV
jgi:hypothetical protein